VAGPRGGSEREAELVATLGAIRSRIAGACIAAGRDPRDVTLIAVTKTRPASDVAALARIGVRDVGESKDQEAHAKLAELVDLGDVPDGADGVPDAVARLRWHIVGRLQTNKARSVVGYAHAVHSLDRLKLVRALADAVTGAQRAEPLDVFAQVSLDGDPDRGGAPVDALDALADAVAARPQLRLRGVMAVPPMSWEPAAAFERLAQLSAGVRASHPSADAISAGMSDDLESALAHGSTHVRVGTALLGQRAPVFG
jgi:PLP dependent protein